VAQKAFDQLVENIKLENCPYCPDVVNAVFRRVPGRVEAENYGHEGPNQSYFVNGTTQNSKYYRISEPVPVEQVGGGQGIGLGEREWTTYTIHSLTAKDYSPVVKARANGSPAVVELSINGRAEVVTITGAEWTEIPLKAMPFSLGANQLKFLVKSGTVSLDWIAFN
jgi:endoglucanase